MELKRQSVNRQRFFAFYFDMENKSVIRVFSSLLLKEKREKKMGGRRGSIIREQFPVSARGNGRVDLTPLPSDAILNNLAASLYDIAKKKPGIATQLAGVLIEVDGDTGERARRFLSDRNAPTQTLAPSEP